MSTCNFQEEKPPTPNPHKWINIDIINHNHIQKQKIK